MLTEQEWNALDDEAPERQFANYLDYVNSVSKPSANAISKQPQQKSEQATLFYEDPDYGEFVNSLSEKDKARYNKLSSEGRETNFNAWKERRKYEKADTNEDGGTARNEVIADTLSGPTENTKSGVPVNQGLGTVESGSVPVTERQEQLATDNVPDVPDVNQEEKEETDTSNEEVESDVTGSIARSISNDLGNEDDQPIVQDKVEEGIDEVKKDKKGRFALKSIFQAYKDGDIDKATRDYMVIDAIATFAKNLGKDFQNIAAAYTGGTIDNERAESLWDQRNKKLSEAANEQSVREDTNEARANDSFDLDRKAQELGITTQQLKNESLQITNALNRMTERQRTQLEKEFDKLINKAPNDTVKTNLLTLKAQAVGAGGGNMSVEDVAVMGGTELWDWLKGLAGIK